MPLPDPLPGMRKDAGKAGERGENLDGAALRGRGKETVAAYGNGEIRFPLFLLPFHPSPFLPGFPFVQPSRLAIGAGLGFASGLPSLRQLSGLLSALSESA